MNIAEMLQKRAALWEQAKALLETARNENRGLSGEEQSQYDKLLKDMEDLKATADREARAAQIEAEMRASAGGVVRPTTSTENRGTEENAEYRSAMDTYLRRGTAELTHDQRALLAEQRSMSAVTGNLGGYAIVQASFGRLIDEMKSFGGLRLTRAEVLTTNSGEGMPVPIGDDAANKGRRLAEGQTAATNVDPAFSQRALDTFLYTSEIVKAPFALLQDSMFDIEGWLWRKLAERIARITNEEMTTADGSSKPLGIVPASGAGKVAPTGQTTTVAYADLVDLLLSVDAAYRLNGEWMFNDNVLKSLMKLVDGDSRPLWVPSLVAGVPDMVLGKRYTINNDMADPAASAKPIVFGDLSLYKIRDVRGAIIKRLEEKYIEEGMVGFVMFSRHGGTLASVGKAVKHFQNAAS